MQKILLKYGNRGNKKNRHALNCIVEYKMKFMKRNLPLIDSLLSYTKPEKQGNILISGSSIHLISLKHTGNS